MFGGDLAEVGETLGDACGTARSLGSRWVGSEHLLLALSRRNDDLGGLLRAAGVTPGRIEGVLARPGIQPAAIEAERAALAVLGVELDEVRRRAESGLGAGVLDPRPGRPPLLPFGGRRAREWAARHRPPIGPDVQAIYEASLRLALARRETHHRIEHLALSMLTLDRGTAWLLDQVGADREALETAVHRRFPLPVRNGVLRLDRRLGWGSRRRDIARRFATTSGTPALGPMSLTLT